MDSSKLSLFFSFPQKGNKFVILGCIDETDSSWVSFGKSTFVIKGKTKLNTARTIVWVIYTKRIFLLKSCFFFINTAEKKRYCTYFSMYNIGSMCSEGVGMCSIIGGFSTFSTFKVLTVQSGRTSSDTLDTRMSLNTVIGLLSSGQYFWHRIWNATNTQTRAHTHTNTQTSIIRST